MKKVYLHFSGFFSMIKNLLRLSKFNLKNISPNGLNNLQISENLKKKLNILGSHLLWQSKMDVVIFLNAIELNMILKKYKLEMLKNTLYILFRFLSFFSLWKKKHPGKFLRLFQFIKRN